MTGWQLKGLTIWERGQTLYVFCHCPQEEQAPALCAALYQRVQAIAPLPTLPWQPEPPAVKPPTLFDMLSDA